MTIDTMILNSHIVLNSYRSKLDKKLIWGKVVNLSSKALKDQGESKTVKFQGMIRPTVSAPQYWNKTKNLPKVVLRGCVWKTKMNVNT
jgi:hypothetical protein